MTLGSEDRRRQFAALPWRRGDAGVEYLLVTSRETRRWIIPKGWPMRDKTGQGAALQEAWEESGATGVIDDQPLGVFSYRKRLASGRDQVCLVRVHALEVQDLADSWPEQHERERRWMSAQEAIRAVDEPELKILMAVFAAQTD